jgi:hypothetical protein
MNHVSKGMIIAGAAAALILGGNAVARASSHSEGVKCVGGNACSGKGECGTATHSCAGQNECKGKGWVMKKSAEECKEAGGTPEEPKQKEAK